MKEKRLELVEIETARQAIDELDRIRREKGISQMHMAERLNDPDVGMRWARMYGSGNAKIAYVIKAAKELGVKVYFSKWGVKDP